jgi:hypothetical protein
VVEVAGARCVMVAVVATVRDDSWCKSMRVITTHPDDFPMSRSCQFFERSRSFPVLMARDDDDSSAMNA